MEPKYKTYPIQTGDTLLKVSERLGVDPIDIRRFHNIYCDIPDLIEQDFPPGLKEFIISYDMDEAIHAPGETPRPKEVVFGLGKKLVLTPVAQQIYYGVMFTITTGEETNTMTYKVSVRCIDQEPKEYHLFEINKLTPTFINDEEPNTIADELAEKVASVLYPLVVVTHKNGKWADIYNIDDIQQRWAVKKQELLEEYEGPWAEEYLSLVGQSLENRQRLNQSFEDNWFLNAFFSGIYVAYTEALAFERTVAFPLLTGTAAVEYTVKQKIEKHLDEGGFINMAQDGELSDPRAKADFENESRLPFYGLDNTVPKATGSYRSKYLLNPKNNTIDTLFLECDIALDIPKKVTIVISLLGSYRDWQAKKSPTTART